MKCANTKPLPEAMTPRCTFTGGDENGAFTAEQLWYSCKLRRDICARCGMHRAEHPFAGVREEDLPPRKRSAFRKLVQFQEPKEQERTDPDEGEIWSGDTITKGKRNPRRKRAAPWKFE